MKFKLITGLLGLGLTIAIPGAVMAQYDLQNDQIPDQDSQVAAAPNSDQGPSPDSNSNPERPELQHVRAGGNERRGARQSDSWRCLYPARR